MASPTRSPSPAAASEEPAPGLDQMTPRSKIKALLARIDEDSDEDSNSGPLNQKLVFRRLTKPATEQRDEGDEEDEDEEEHNSERDAPVAGFARSHGRLAARMHGLETQQQSGPSSPREVNMEDKDDDDDDVVRIAHRRRRQARSSTPENTFNAHVADSPASPGLFVSPSPQKVARSRGPVAGSDTEDEDLPSNLGGNPRFQALVARKREERLAREAEEERRRQEHAKRVTELAPEDGDDDDDDDVSDITDDDGGRRLTQRGLRPAVRKASKKALEEMNRETERLKRSLQLAHEAKTKKKMTKAALFERFNFKAAGSEKVSSDKTLTSSSAPITPKSGAQTDAEMGEVVTPPSSPPSIAKAVAVAPTIQDPEAQRPQERQDAPAQEVEDEELPSLDDVLKAFTSSNKGKGKATPGDLATSPKQKAVPAVSKPKRHFRVLLPPQEAD
jgi:mediator of replication checkpoint protein 1